MATSAVLANRASLPSWHDEPQMIRIRPLRFDMSESRVYPIQWSMCQYELLWYMWSLQDLCACKGFSMQRISVSSD